MKTEHYPVFDCAIGERAVHYTGHVKMMGAIQPFISGAISKTVNMPEAATIDDVAQRLRRRVEARREGDRDLPRQLQGRAAAVGQGRQGARARSRRRRVDRSRSATASPTTAPRSAASSASASTRATSTSASTTTARPGDIFVDIAKEGTTLAGLMNSFMISVSLGLQYGVPLEVYVSKFAHMRFEPSGAHERPGHPRREVDRRLRLPLDGQEVPHGRPAGGDRHPLARGARPHGRRVRERRPGGAGARAPATPGQTALFNTHEDAIECSRCGGRMVSAGTCYTCRDCGTSTGCG